MTLLNFTSFSRYFHTSVPSKLIFVFVLNLMEVDITDRQYLKYLNQAWKSTGNYWTAMENQEQYSKATWIMEIYLITTTKHWTEDVRESHKIQHICKFKIESSDVMKYKQHCLHEWLDNDWHKKEASFDTKD